MVTHHRIQNGSYATEEENIWIFERTVTVQLGGGVTFRNLINCNVKVELYRCGRGLDIHELIEVQSNPVITTSVYATPRL